MNDAYTAARDETSETLVRLNGLSAALLALVREIEGIDFDTIPNRALLGVARVLDALTDDAIRLHDAEGLVLAAPAGAKPAGGA